MTKRLLIACLLLNIINTNCQTFESKKSNTLIGIWQAGTNEISSAYLDTYTFNENNKFEFKPNEYNGLNRIIKISGTYRIQNSEIIFHTETITELTGGEIERSTTTTLSDSWSIDGGKLITKKINKTKQKASFKFCKSEGDKQNCFKIDERSYFKID